MSYLDGVAMNGFSGLTLGGCALVIALSSPIPVVVTLVLLVHNDRPRWSSIGFLSGRVVTLNRPGFDAHVVMGAQPLMGLCL